ncbi:MAG TPA: Eco57I restriction-modification methylase domain-containing protein [Candidatus Brocadiia bacterium]|nr:Eco57I restriction-modification methylase domain-containing protein [Candidatus Brocadiales bacterium]
MNTSEVKEHIQNLVEKFERDKHHYLSKDYIEAQVRQDFIDPFFETLDWDISNEKKLSPFEREVLVEKGETTGRPDYNFRLNGISKFFVEAKAPSESLDTVKHILQAKSYAWNTKEVFIVVLTDFEELKLFDASLPPDKRNPLQGIIIDLKYTDYLNNIEKLLLLSKEAVAQGSLDRLLLKDASSKRQRIPVDKKFLQDMSLWREELAKDVYRHNSSISVRTLNEVVQRLLDRIVFIRIAEDRNIIKPRTLFEITELWKAEGKRRPIQYHLNNLFREINADLNGDIFKPHACEQYEVDSHRLANIIEELYFPNSPYLFDIIGVELLGSIYERYLGNTIRVTPGGRVKVEEKPEVRKAGGVYYTPQYIVKYIVENTVGKLITGKTPKQIEKLRLLDPACGSGSFLLGAFQYLIDYHIQYYREHPKEAETHPLFPDLIRDAEDNYRLSIIKKGRILKNNIFGVDIDPQAVEITMMSLYLKELEGERSLPQKQGLLPILSNNIKCGNSLIGYDIFDQGKLFPDEERERINPFDWNSKSVGFGEIMAKGGFDCVIGNPPYVRQEMLEAFKEYFQQKYNVFHGMADLYSYFIERGVSLLKPGGIFSYIVANKWMRTNYGEPLRYWMKQKRIEEIIDFGDLPVFQGATTYPCIIRIRNDSPRSIFKVTQVKTLDFDNLESYVQTNSYSVKQTSLSAKGWSLANERIQQLLSKLQAVGIPLGDYVKGKIYRGVLTGFNKAFVIDRETRNRLIAEDPKSVELIKPFLIGRDIKRYQPHQSNKYLIFTRRGVNIKMYPAIERHLKQFKEKLMPKPKDWQGDDWKGRKPGSYQWYEIQDAIDYYAEFEKPKIMYLVFQVKPAFTFDSAGTYANNAVWIMPKDDKYLLGILNSMLGWLLISNFCTQIQNGYQLIFEYLGKLPIRTINFDDLKERAMHDRLVGLVERMLELNRKKQALPASSEREAVESEIAVADERIDELVYELYGITEKEREIIEG